MSELLPRWTAHCSSWDRGCDQLSTSVIHILHKLWRATHSLSSCGWTKTPEPSWLLGTCLQSRRWRLWGERQPTDKTGEASASVLNHFWRRWRSEYLNKRSERAIATQRSKLRVILLCPRETLLSSMMMLYHMGSGNLDESKRSSSVVMGCTAPLTALATRDRQHVLLRRPLQLLYPLEIHEAETPETSSEDAPASISDVRISAPVDEHGAPTPKEPERRPMRATAKRANEKIRAWTRDLQD